MVEVYEFGPGVVMEDIAVALLLAGLATENLCGVTPVLVAGHYAFDGITRTCVLETTTRLGREFRRLFERFLWRDVRPESVQITAREPAASRREVRP